MPDQDNTEDFEQSYSVVKRVSSTRKMARFPDDYKNYKRKGRIMRDENNKRDSQSEYTVVRIIIFLPVIRTSNQAA